MHIPAEMLNGAICPVSAGLAVVGAAGAAAVLLRNRAKAPTPAKFALASAAIFGLQMLNYPIWNGISGHLLGGALAAALLGVPAGMLSMVLVLSAQALLFADGGLSMLGANALNMALIGVGAAGLLDKIVGLKIASPALRQGVAAAGSVLCAVAALCMELACSGHLSAAVAGTLFGVHAALALVEGLATALIAHLLADRAAAERHAPVLAGVILASFALTPFASSAPDAFEWTMDRFGLLPEAPNFALAPFVDYVAFGSTHAAAAIGLACVAAIGFGLLSLVRGRAAVEVSR